MSDDKNQKKAATKEYVVVFDQLDVHTGDFTPGGPGHAPTAVAKSYFRADKVQLDDETAKRHLESGAVIPANDKRAKQIEKNPVRSQGVRRDAEVSYAAVALEEQAPAVAGAEGAKRSPAGTLGSEAELKRMSVKDLKALAGEHGVEVTRGMTRPQLAKALAAHSGSDAAGAGAQTDNPGQGKDQSPPEGSVAADAALEDDEHPASKDE